MAAPVYDDEKQRTDRISADELRGITGVSEDQEGAMDRQATSGAAQDILGRERDAATGKANVRQQTQALAGPGSSAKSSSGQSDEDDNSQGESKSEGAQGLRKREQSSNSLFKNDEGGQKKKTIGDTFKDLKNKKRALTIIGALAAVIASVIAGLFSLIAPFKIISIPQFLENKFFAAFENASAKESENLFTSYVRKHVIPGLKASRCSSTKVNRHCVAAVTGNDPISRLYDRWRQNGLEHNLALRGYEIENNGGRFFMRAPGLGNAVSLADVESGRISNMFEMKELSRNQVRAEFRKAFEDESFFKKLMFRYRVRGLLKAKYGIIGCITACNFKDKYFHDPIRTKKRAFMAYFVKRVIEPRSVALSVVFQCLFQNCDDHLKSEQAPANTDDPLHQEPTDEFDRTTRDSLRAFAARFSSQKLEDLVKNLEDVKKDGLGKYALKKIITKGADTLFGKEVSTEVLDEFLKGTGPIGWALLAVRIFYFLEHGGKQLKKYAFVVNSAAMISAFYFYRTISDEVRANHANSTIIGSVTDSMSGNIDGRSTDPIEASPLYKATFSSARYSPTAALMNALLPQKAYALGATDLKGTEKCNSGKTVQQEAPANPGLKGALCRELWLGTGTAIVEGLANIGAFITAIPVLGSLINVAGQIVNIVGTFINNIIGIVTGPLLKLVEPLLNAVIGSFIDFASGIINWVKNLLIAELFPDDFSSARIFDVMAGGADAAGNDTCHRQLGCQTLTTDQQIAINGEQQQRQNEAFAALPLKDRVLSTDYEQSFISQVALNMPSDATAAAQESFVGLLSNPLGKLANSFASMLVPHKAAAATAKPDYFQLPQYGYPTDSYVFTVDPGDFWDQYCKDGKIDKAYNLPKTAATVPDELPGVWEADVRAAGFDPAADADFIKHYGYTIDDNTGQTLNDTANPCFLIKETSNYDQTPADPAGGGGTGGGDSGQAIPLGDLAGWKQVFADDFTTAQPLGSWATSDAGKNVRTADHIGSWVEYPDGWPATYTGGAPGYSPSTVIEVAGGDLIFHLHDNLGANPSPVLSTGSQYQTYGRYEARLKTSTHTLPSYYMAWLLWPENEGDWQCAESDWPETSLDGNSVNYFHHNCGGQDPGSSDVDLTQWHNYIQEWMPGKRNYYLDDKLVGNSTTSVYSKPERWQLQTEVKPGGGEKGDLFVDWVVVYSYAGG